MSDAPAPRAFPGWADVRVGDELPPLSIEVTATVIVAGAIATRDFMPVHHDRSFANAQGAPDIFMNILTSNAYCSRFLTDWAGPRARIRQLAIRLGVPVFPQSVLRFTGSVTDREHGPGSTPGAGTVTVALRASNDLGDHLTGTAVLTLP